jgi:hypothetical protein
MPKDTQTIMRFLTSKDVLGMLQCSPRHLLNLRRRRLIPFIKLGRAVRYSPDEVARAISKLSVKELE